MPNKSSLLISNCLLFLGRGCRMSKQWREASLCSLCWAPASPVRALTQLLSFRILDESAPPPTSRLRQARFLPRSTSSSISAMVTSLPAMATLCHLADRVTMMTVRTKKPEDRKQFVTFPQSSPNARPRPRPHSSRKSMTMPKTTGPLWVTVWVKLKLSFAWPTPVLLMRRKVHFSKWTRRRSK